MELVKRIYLNASNENRNREVTKGIRPYLLRFIIVIKILFFIIDYILLFRWIFVFYSSYVSNYTIRSWYIIYFMSSITSKSWVINLKLSYVNIFYILIFIFSKIIYNDLQSITPEQYYKEIHNRRIAEIHAVSVNIISLTLFLSVLLITIIISESFW